MTAHAKKSRSSALSPVAAAVPNYEVKLYLDPARVLDVEFKPTRDVDRAFDGDYSCRRVLEIRSFFYREPSPCDLQ